MKNDSQTFRIAHIVGKWVGGGVEAVIMNYYKHINHNKIQFDFIFDEDSKEIPFDEIEKLGGKVILVPPYQKIFKYYRQLKKVLKDGNYKIVHSHINVLSVFPLLAAKRVGIPIRIAHSHSTTNKIEWKKNILKNLFKPFSKLFATNYFACTEHAGRWLFGNKSFDKGKVYVLNNAIDVEKFKYNEEIRNKIRKELNINDNILVIGHVGRFVEQKNHEYIIDVFNKLFKEKSDSILLLIGQGPLQGKILSKVKALGLENNVKFLGQVNNVNEYYQVFDVLLFPSLYEGLGMALIEAQCSGCYCIASTEVPEIAKITNNFKFLNLTDTINVWKEALYNANKIKRISNIDNVSEKGFNINIEVKKLEKKYLDLFNDSQVIELFGIPACGKSYLANNILKHYTNLNNKYIYNSNRIIRNIKKCLSIFKFIVIRPDMFIKTLKILNMVKFKKTKIKIKMYMYLFSTLYICYKGKMQNTKVLLEEGILQVLWGICYNMDYTDEFIKFYIELYEEFIGDKVYIVDTNIEIIKKRLLERNQKGGSELEHDIYENEQVIIKAKNIKDKIVNVLYEKNINLEII